MPEHTRPGDVLADRYRLTDLLTESKGGRFWRAFDSVLQRDGPPGALPVKPGALRSPSNCRVSLARSRSAKPDVNPTWSSMPLSL